MERDSRAGKFLEHGEYEGNMYGTKVDTIRDVMRSGKMCILDVNPTVCTQVVLGLCCSDCRYCWFVWCCSVVIGVDVVALVIPLLLF